MLLIEECRCDHPPSGSQTNIDGKFARGRLPSADVAEEQHHAELDLVTATIFFSLSPHMIRPSKMAPELASFGLYHALLKIERDFLSAIFIY